MYGSFTDTGSTPDSSPFVYSYSTWQNMSLTTYALSGGGAGGGAGGDGQAADPPGGNGPLLRASEPTGGNSSHNNQSSTVTTDLGTVARLLLLGKSAVNGTSPGGSPLLSAIQSNGTWASLSAAVGNHSDSKLMNALQSLFAPDKHAQQELRTLIADGLFADLVGNLT